MGAHQLIKPDADLRWLAYILATDYHETAYTMQPIEEYGKGAGYDYGEPDPVTGEIYFGTGLVQLNVESTTISSLARKSTLTCTGNLNSRSKCRLRCA